MTTPGKPAPEPKSIKSVLELVLKNFINWAESRICLDQIDFSVVLEIRLYRALYSRSEFLKDTLLQEEAMLKLLLHNKKRLQKYIDKYEGKVVHGILVTESGLLAAAHLGGQGSVKKWFRNGRIRKDGNGVKITSYMKRFGGYILDL